VATDGFLWLRKSLNKVPTCRQNNKNALNVALLVYMIIHLLSQAPIRMIILALLVGHLNLDLLTLKLVGAAGAKITAGSSCSQGEPILTKPSYPIELYRYP